MFASKVQRDVQVGDVTVTIRKLSGRSLEKASEARQIAVAHGMKQMGGDVLKSLRDVERPATPAEPDYVALTKARYTTYDRAAVLLMGIVRWTDERALDTAALEDLDEGSAQHLHEAILDLSLPPLDPKVFEAEQGKGSGLSISS